MKQTKKKYPFFAFVFINSTFNNTIITATDLKGQILVWASGGSTGFKGAKRSTSYAAQAASEQVAKKIVENGVGSIQVMIKGLNNSCESALRGLKTANLIITSIKDINPIPHNGCRPPKRRRI
jgi:small subunit ribosomal protein S11